MGSAREKGVAVRDGCAPRTELARGYLAAWREGFQPDRADGGCRCLGRPFLNRDSQPIPAPPRASEPLRSPDDLRACRVFRWPGRRPPSSRGTTPRYFFVAGEGIGSIHRVLTRI